MEISTSYSKEEFTKIMHEEGVCVFKNFIDDENIKALIKTITHIKKRILTKISRMKRPLRTYSDIAERELGRLDYRCGFTSDLFRQIGEPIIHLIKTISPTIDFNHYWGALSSQSGAGSTNMHRDVYSLLNTTMGQNLDPLDISLPPYYFTVLMPLLKITKAHGPTEFIKGSHHRTCVDENKAEKYAPLLSPGDMVVFDGRLLHRGLPNQTTEERSLAYITLTAKWYHDQTFVINDYLFKALSNKGKSNS